MDPCFESLLHRVDQLSSQFRELKEGVSKAIRIADEDPEMALTRARKVLEYVIRDVFERRRKEPPGTRPLENLLQLLVKEGHFPDRLDAYATTIRKLGNVGTHSFGEKVTVADVHQSLTQLMPILEWYFEAERPQGVSQQPAPWAGPEAAAPSGSSTVAPPQAEMAIVPKGLRSFDAQDADFFLDLLPGPRDKDGLPESIRFWKHRVEETEEPTFTVGVIYGPSGCGKSSLVKAGLLPRLADSVTKVYVEATGEKTEAGLLAGLRRQLPDLPAEMGLVEALAALRRGQFLVPGRNVLLVVDQFEQWLHAKRNDENTELVRALRQCDGSRVRSIVMVRDDFWLALSRFMADLDVELLQGQNMALVDLFDPRHARKVLAAFGRAFGALPQGEIDLTKDQEGFLDQAVAGLAQDGKVICVRLALFAGMVHHQPWIAATLRKIGGAEGVGFTFLEETFAAATAPPQYRLHQQAAQAVLKALLPEAGSDIKGHLRPQQELLEVSGYVSRLKDFAELLRILDGELRLITPTDPEGAGSQNVTPRPGAEKSYQLTHDYLVPSLRDWLTQKQRQTRRGRAELRLAERSASWNAKPENRHLPSLGEFCRIQLFTRKKNWNGPQQKMMGRATRVHGVRWGIAAAVLAIAGLTGMGIRNAVVEKQNATRAEGLVDGLLKADIAEVPSSVSRLKEYRTWADPLLKQAYEQAPSGSKSKLHAALALSALRPADQAPADFLGEQLLIVTPQQFSVVRDFLLPPKADLVEHSWQAALDAKRSTPERFQAACALASYAPGDPRWSQVSTPVARHLVTLQASDFLAWRDALRPAKGQLIRPLTAIYQEKAEREQCRTYATEALADYAADRPEVLFNLLATAEQFKCPLLLGKVTVYAEKALALAQAELARSLPEAAGEDQKETSAQRQANAAVVLFKLGTPEKVWPLLRFSPDPRVRSYLIHGLGPLGADPQTIIERLNVEPDVTIRRALVLMLGEFSEAQLPPALRPPLIEKLLAVFANEPDAGLHATAQWLLQKWDQGQRLQAALEKLRRNETQLQAERTNDQRHWYVNGQEQTLVILDARDVFRMGSPESEPDRGTDEKQHRVHIGRRYAIGATAVTKKQFTRFQDQCPKVAKIDTTQWVKTDDSPQTWITWYEAAWYCNWLSEQEGIAAKQRCYEPNEKGEYGPGMKAKDKYLELAGYRLPTEAEWEYACRAGTETSRYYGLSETLLGNYAWYLANGRSHTRPVASLKPNDFGLFDMHGNVWTWCDDLYQGYPEDTAKVFEDSGRTEPVTNDSNRILRGGSFFHPPSAVRSAIRAWNLPANRGQYRGFRVARTYN